MKGTEKQIKFANDILAKINEVASITAVLEDIRQEIINRQSKDESWKQKKLEKVDEVMKDASFIISSFKDYFNELRYSPALTKKLGESYAKFRIAAALQNHASIAKYANKVAKAYKKEYEKQL